MLFLVEKLHVSDKEGIICKNVNGNSLGWDI